MAHIDNMGDMELQPWQPAQQPRVQQPPVPQEGFVNGVLGQMNAEVIRVPRPIGNPGSRIVDAYNALPQATKNMLKDVFEQMQSQGSVAARKVAHMMATTKVDAATAEIIFSQLPPEAKKALAATILALKAQISIDEKIALCTLYPAAALGQWLRKQLGITNKE